MLKPKHPCSQPGCRTLIVAGMYCVVHQPKRASASAQGYDAKWAVYSRSFLRRHPICCDPFNRHRGQIIAARVTGHRVAHKGNEQLKWSPANHYPLCVSCNSYQCVQAEGGFGRAQKPA